jgi:phosphatidyl-myo-inositol dimannoside synthase
LKILILSSEFPPAVGGIGTYANNLSRGLGEVGMEVKVITFGKRCSKSLEGNIETFYISSFWNKKFFKILPLSIVTLWVCLIQKPEKVLAMVWTHEGIVGLLFKKILNMKYILMTHGSEILKHKDSVYGRIVMKKVFEEAESICANSNFTKELVASLGFKEVPVSVIHPTVPVCERNVDSMVNEVDEKFNLHGKRVLLTVSRLVPRKGHALIIEALALLLPSYSDLIYVMTGKGIYGKKLEEIAKEKGVLDRVKFTGFLSDREVSLLYDRCEIYVSPSYEIDQDVEGFGIALAEASAHAKPVIAGQCGGVGDAVLDGETGLLISEPNVEKLVSCISRLLDDRLLQNKLGETGRRYVEAELNSFSQIRKFLKVFNSDTLPEKLQRTERAG